VEPRSAKACSQGAGGDPQVCHYVECVVAFILKDKSVQLLGAQV
jgi:hypothetical protein